MNEVLADAGGIVVMRASEEGPGMSRDYGAAIQSMLDMRKEEVIKGVSYDACVSFLEKHGHLFGERYLSLSARDVEGLDAGGIAGLEAAGCVLRTSRDAVRKTLGVDIDFALPGAVMLGKGAEADGVFLVNMSLEPQGSERMGCCSVFDTDRAVRWLAYMGVAYRAGIEGEALHERYSHLIEINRPGASEDNPEGLASIKMRIPQAVFGYDVDNVEDGSGPIVRRDGAWYMWQEEASADIGNIAARALAAAYAEDSKRSCECAWDREQRRFVLQVGEANSFVRESVRLASDGRICTCPQCGRPVVNAHGKSARFCRKRHCYQRYRDKAKHFMESGRSHDETIAQFPHISEKTIRNWV